MVTVNGETYDYVIQVGHDVIVGGNLDGHYTYNRMYALYRKGVVVGYTMRQMSTRDERQEEPKYRRSRGL